MWQSYGFKRYHRNLILADFCPLIKGRGGFSIFAQNLKKMKQASFILNFVLLIAVGFLYYKVYSGADQTPVILSNQAASSRIVFVNSDSLMDNYALFKEAQDKMEKKRDSLDQLLTGRGKALEREIKEYQDNASGMSSGERQLREESLMRKQQGLMDERDRLLDLLKEEEASLTDSIHNDLMKSVKEFNKKFGYDFILGYTRGSGILYANDSLDITQMVLQRLNK